MEWTTFDDSPASSPAGMAPEPPAAPLRRISQGVGGASSGKNRLAPEDDRRKAEERATSADIAASVSPPPPHVALRFGSDMRGKAILGMSSGATGSGRTKRGAAGAEEHRALAAGCGFLFNIYSGGFAAYSSSLDDIMNGDVGGGGSGGGGGAAGDVRHRLLVEDHGASQPRSIVVDVEANLVITGHQDGKVRFWRPPTVTAARGVSGGGNGSMSRRSGVAGAGLDVFINNNINIDDNQYGSSMLKLSQTALQSSGSVADLDGFGDGSENPGLTRKQSVLMKSKLEQYIAENSNIDDASNVFYRTSSGRIIGDASDSSGGGGADVEVTSDNAKILSFVAHRSPVSAMCIVRASPKRVELWTGARNSMRHWDVDALIRGNNRNIYSGNKANVNLNSFVLGNGSRKIHSVVRFIVSAGQGGLVGDAAGPGSTKTTHSLVVSGGSSKVQIWDAPTKACLCSVAFEGSRLVSHLAQGEGGVDYVAEQQQLELGGTGIDATSVFSAGFTAASQLHSNSMHTLKGSVKKAASGKTRASASPPATAAGGMAVPHSGSGIGSTSSKSSKRKGGFFSSLSVRQSQLFMEDDIFDNKGATDDDGSPTATTTVGHADFANSRSSSFQSSDGHELAKSVHTDDDSGDDDDVDLDIDDDEEEEEEDDTIDADGVAVGNDKVRTNKDGGINMSHERLAAIVASPNGIAFTIFSSGLIIATTASPSSLPGASQLTNTEFMIFDGKNKLSSKVTAACIPFEGRLWLGTSSGFIIVISYTRTATAVVKLTNVGLWHPHKVKNDFYICNAHTSCGGIKSDGVLSMTTSSESKLIFCLYRSGKLIAHMKESPWRGDAVVHELMSSKATSSLYLTPKSLNVVVGTWNVNEKKASRQALSTWLRSTSGGRGDIIVVNLQEVEMSSSSMMYQAAAKTVNNINMQWNGSRKASLGSATNATSWWMKELDDVINDGRGPSSAYELVAFKELGGMVMAVFIQKRLLMDDDTASSSFSDEDDESLVNIDANSIVTGSVATGVGDVLGNKGGVAVAMTVYDKRLYFINSHLAAHRKAVEKRNSDFNKIVKKLQFEAGTSKTPIVYAFDDSDVCVWAGDLNYRIDEFTYESVIEDIRRGHLHKLQPQDQLNKERYANRVFRNFLEPPIFFPPTYKFDKGATSILAYDSSEKKRVPAWCDRVLVRDSTSSSPVAELDAVIDASGALTQLPSTKVIFKEYTAEMHINDSDHKPVRANLKVYVAKVNEPVKRFVVGNALRTAYESIDDFSLDDEDDVYEGDEDAEDNDDDNGPLLVL